MRLSTALVSLSVVLGASPAYANCVPGERVISSGYKVMVECGTYPIGPMSNAASVEDCALKCEGTASICSYEPRQKLCMVAPANGTPAKLAGVISMTPIKSDCCPELQTCKDENTKCAGDLADALKKIDDKDKELSKAKKDLDDANSKAQQAQKGLDDANKKLQQSQNDLDSCKSASGSGGSTGSGTPGTGTPGTGAPPNQKPLNRATCGDYKGVPDRTHRIRTISANQVLCKSACQANPNCQAYAVLHWSDAKKSGACHLFSKPTAELKAVPNKNFRLYDRDCKN